jgi:hypothetical protein
MVMPLDNVTESKRKCASDTETTKRCKVVSLGKFLDGMGETSRRYFTLMLNFPTIYYYITQFVHE